MNIFESIAGIMSEGASIAKAKRNQQQGFQYRGIDDVMNTFQPLLSKYKVFIVPEVIDQKREERQTTKGGNLLYSVLTIKYTFFAEDGSSVSAVVVGEGMDSGDKASNKAMSVAMKYAMFQTFCIPTEEMSDPDAETPALSTKKDAEPQKKAEPEPTLVCSRCGKKIVAVKNSKGQTQSPAEQAAYSRKEFGHDYCLKCSKEAYMERRVAADKALDDVEKKLEETA